MPSPLRSACQLGRNPIGAKVSKLNGILSLPVLQGSTSKGRSLAARKMARLPSIDRVASAVESVVDEPVGY